MALSPFAGFVLVLEPRRRHDRHRVLARRREFILIVFRINEHLGAIRDQGGGVR